MEVVGKILSDNTFPVVGVGASAGGLEAFKLLIKAIPQRSGVAYVLVQHLAPTHESQLPELLQKVTPIPVVEISDDIKVQPDHIYILPSNKMLVANDGVLQLSPRPTTDGELNLPIDLFFTSLAEIHQSHAIGVVLSGTGNDGTKGLKAIKNYGGITFAQEEASAGQAGMPRSAIQAGVVDFVLPPEEIPPKVLAVIRLINGDDRQEATAPTSDQEVFTQILSLLRVRKGTDFTYYKPSTIRRRILRRMAINIKESPADYLHYLQQNKSEQDVLYHDLLIPVTQFFRDHPVFDNLCNTVFPSLVEKNAGDPIRIWVAGCSTGQEAYSIAMCFAEFLGAKLEGVQIFATDLSEPAIAKARSGRYTKNELDGLSPQRLQAFFTKIDGKYQIIKRVRDMCVFAAHNFLNDPPFGRMDFISCRNVLIYMEPLLQKKALTTFHYALNPGRFLLLGKSETTSLVANLFTASVKSDKLFTRKDAVSRFMATLSQQNERNPKHPKVKNETMQADYQKAADELILSKYTPAGVVINENLDIVHFRGNTSPYLEQSPGKPTHNLLLLARNGLAFELRSMVHKAKKDNVLTRKENIPLSVNGSVRTIMMETMPLPNTVEPHYLILFHDTSLPTNGPSAVGTKKATVRSKKDDSTLRIQQLEQELAQTRQDMVGITEDQETINEELQSANEELLSSNEELQSLNEELESSKEEFQSTNEELTIVNQEMIKLNQQVAAARDYADAILATIREPLLVLDATLRIQTANKAFYNTFRVNEGETEDRLIYDLGDKQWNIPELRTLLEKILPEKSTFEGFKLTHTFSSIGQRTLLLNAREIINTNSQEKLILLSIEEITAVENGQQA